MHGMKNNVIQLRLREALLFIGYGSKSKVFCLPFGSRPKCPPFSCCPISVVPPLPNPPSIENKSFLICILTIFCRVPLHEFIVPEHSHPDGSRDGLPGNSKMFDYFFRNDDTLEHYPECSIKDLKYIVRCGTVILVTE